MPSLSCETESKLRTYQALLHKWQEKINLISPKTLADSWNRHFVDSLQLLPLLPEGVKTLYDLGSGAGFPGLVIAVSRPDIAVTMIESDSKKCAFLQAVSRETGVAPHLENKRIEAAVLALDAPDMVSARALASLTALLSYCRPWLETRPDLMFLFPKGASFQQEIDEAWQAGWRFHVEQFPSQTEPDARILRLSNVTLERA